MPARLPPALAAAALLLLLACCDTGAASRALLARPLDPPSTCDRCRKITGDGVVRRREGAVARSATLHAAALPPAAIFQVSGR